MPYPKASNPKRNLKLSLFQRDGRGQYVFFPLGSWGEGYIVRDPQQRKRISRLSSVFMWSFFLVQFFSVSANIFHHAVSALWSLGVAVILLFVAYPIFKFSMVEGLPASRMKYIPLSRYGKVFPQSILWVRLIVFAGGGLLFLSLVLNGWGIRPMTGELVLTLVLFGAGASTFWQLWKD